LLTNRGRKHACYDKNRKQQSGYKLTKEHIGQASVHEMAMMLSAMPLDLEQQQRGKKTNINVFQVCYQQPIRERHCFSFVRAGLFTFFYKHKDSNGDKIKESLG
jgi:hypothetical protein